MIGSPRPHIGADINTSGNTSDGYFGLTWGIMLIQSLFGAGDGVFANGSLGGAIHDGYIDSAPPGEKRLGSRILFRESAELGYQINPKLTCRRSSTTSRTPTRRPTTPASPAPALVSASSSSASRCKRIAAATRCRICPLPIPTADCGWPVAAAICRLARPMRGTIFPAYQ